jgi:polar amino acid transport system substrate-binding protein
MGLREGDDELRETFDAIIAELKADGTLNEMIAKWFGDDAQLYDVSE